MAFLLAQGPCNLETLVMSELQHVLTQAQFSALNSTSPRAVSWRLSRFGSYFGVTPIKLANRRNLWPAIRVIAQPKEQNDGGPNE
jgi:hypothetical protein